MGSTTLKVDGEHKRSVAAVMPSFISQTPVSNSMATEGKTINSSRHPDFGSLEQYLGYRIGETANDNRKATPKSLMRVMEIHGLTLYHLKSHLQKYRQGKSQQSQTCNETTQEEDRVSEG